VVADGTRLPLRDRSVDLVCFAQSWHWLDAALRAGESGRVLTPGGRWAGWWSHARADGRPWFEESWAAIESVCPGTERGQRDIDWGEDLARSGRFAVGGRQTFGWVRHITVDDWLTDQRSHSYVARLDDASREMLLDQLSSIVRRGFPGGDMVVPYETWLWTARLL
jgi:SAM-dependent methyltransferase